MGQDTAVRASRQRAEAGELLSDLIRIDTQNPPGNERPAQDLLAARLGDAGFECSTEDIFATLEVLNLKPGLKEVRDIPTALLLEACKGCGEDRTGR